MSKFGKLVNEDLNFTLEKLFNGIACNVPNIQLNYSMALQQILSKFQKEIQLNQLLTYICEITDPK